MKAKIPKSISFRTWAGITVSAISVYLLLRKFSYQDFKNAFMHVKIEYVLLTLVLVAANIVGKTMRWKILIELSQQRLRFSRILISWLVGQTMNLVLLGRVGEIARVYMIGRTGSERAFVVGTIVVEKILDTLLYAFLLFLALCMISLPMDVYSSMYLFTFATCGIVLSVMVAVRYQAYLLRWLETTRWFSTRLKLRLKTYLAAGFACFDIFHSPRQCFILLGLSAFVSGTAVLMNYVVFFALNIQAPLIAALLLMLVLQAGVSIPSVPGRIGVFEYLCILTLVPFGVEHVAALNYGILLHTVTLILPTICGLLFWLLNPVVKQEEAIV